MTFYCHHGVEPAERQLGQKLIIDVELRLDLSAVGLTDDIHKVVNYRKVYEQVQFVATHEEVNLLETIAHRIAQRVLERFPVEEVVVGVCKPQPPVDGLVDAVRIEIVRSKPVLDSGASASPKGEAR